ncbi:RNA-directed DNA polymerase from mobile element jockey [Elysia marginata]|uniref:RNA-directed DNA polymerase from mobile element jockey n=1 Tax=Elysia marginata TaxID=1093978 RepID=A0AAV4GIL4_9GAST|nr:RNA-directed DNA polymerase from mobile element jockey [Elysia marginata]
MKKPGRNSKTEIASKNLKAINREEFTSDITRALLQADTLNAILRETLDNHAPLMTRALRSCRNAPWFNTQVKEAKRERRAAERKWNKTRSSGDIYICSKQIQQRRMLCEATALPEQTVFCWFMLGTFPGY